MTGAPAGPWAPPAIDAGLIEAAREAGAGIVRHTPVLVSRTLSERCGGSVLLKAENLQRAGSFKLRGALSKIAALGASRAPGVVAGSAGNHAQALADAARERDLRCEVFMPEEGAVAKADAARHFGATIHLVAGSVEDAVQAAQRHAQATGMAFVHPFDDPAVIAGQATLGLELLEDAPDLARIVVPLGGGGLASGVAIAVRSARPEVEVIGVQAELCAPYSRHGDGGVTDPGATIADGIAVARTGALTGPLVEQWLADVIAVGEEAIGEAMTLLVERAKLVVEGAGAVGVAALITGRVRPARHGSTLVVLSGGNVDIPVLAGVARRHETEAGRRMVVLTRISDRPGGLARLLTCVAEAGANLLDVAHVREGLALHVRETAVEMVLETRGRAHMQAVLGALAQAGYDVRVLH